MKKLLLALFLFVSYSTVNAQFAENFDGVTVNMVNSGPGTWTIDNTLSTSAPNSYRGQYNANSYTSLETPPNAINATGKAFVVLSFQHICKIEFVDSAKIEVSVDGGITWAKLYDHGPGNQNCIYLGNSPSFQANETFSESSYGLTWDPGNASTPTNSWWRPETFDISQIAANQPDIRIRFKSLDAQNPSAIRYGWNIDDINVQLATCELNAPTFGVVTTFSGTVYTLNPQDIQAQIFDASGVPQGGAQLFWTINGGPVQEFQPGIGMFDASGSGVGPYFGTIDNNGSQFNDGDTICWWIQATDGSGCNNVAFYPTGSGQANCQQVIVSSGVHIPYCDAFENAVQVWNADPASVGDLWTLGTPANGSLTAAHSGNNVWGIGLTTPYSSSDESYLLSPVFDFSAVNVANLTFWLNYNTEGSTFSQTDGARIDYALDAGTPVWQPLGFVADPNAKNWYNTANLTSSGQAAWNGNSNGWQKSSYKLGSVAGLPNDPTGVQFRFAFNSDAFGTVEGFLVDDLCIIIPPANDIGVTTYLQPIPNAGQAAGSSSPFSVVVENFGTASQSTFNIGYSITTLGTSSVPYTGTVLAVNSTTNVTLPNFVVPSGAFTICTWTDLTGDGDHSNDTLCSTYVGVPTITPTFCDDFENANVNGWNPVNNGAAGSDWLLGTPAHANLNTANSGVNAWDINLSSTYGPNADAELYSPYFDFSAVSNGKLSFSYNFNTEANWDGTRLDYSTDGGATWNLLGTGGSTGTPNLAGTDPCGTNWYSKASIFSSTQNAWAGNTGGIWRNASYKLCCTNGILLSPTLVQFRFVFTSDASVQVEGFSIDDFCITSSTGDDAGVSAILSPVVGGFPVGVQAHVIVKIENYGSTILTSIPVTYVVAGGVPHTFTYTGSIPICGSVTFAFPDSIGIIQGPNDICAYTDLIVDVNRANDTTCISVIGQPVITSVYNNSFNDNLESGNIGYAPSIDPLGDLGTIWEFGTPAFALTTGAHSPVNAWDVNLTTATTNNAFTYLTTPYFKLKGNANSQHATLRFWQNRDMAAFTDQFYVEFKTGATGGTWTKLGSNGNINGTNWYNVTDNWNGVQGWIKSSFKDIDKLFTAPLPVGDSIIQFRFVYTTGGFASGSNGVSVDDIELYIPIPLSLTPLSVDLSIPNSLILPGQPITFASPIHNDGYNPVFIHNATLVIDNVIVATDFVNYLGTPLQPDSTIIHNFTSTTWIASPGFHKACVYTSGPNGTIDYALYNDTVCSTILVFDSVTTTALPYCNDFESGTQWVTLDAISYSKATDFELGTPNQTHLNSAHSGNKCWTLYVDSNYVNRDSSGLFSSMMRVQTGHCYKLGFWQQFRTEFGSDGGTVEYSDDLGVSWKRIDYTGTPGVISSGGPGTNYSYVIALDPSDPSKKGFTGFANNWFKVEQTIRPNLDGLIIIRWRFASDYSARDEGWSIDDVCFTDLGICTPLGVNEFAIDDFGLSQNYPNPANGNTTIEYMIPHTGSVSIQVTDMIGQVVDVIVSGNESEGKHSIDYNTSKLAPGIYTYTMKFGDRQVTKRMVITE